MGYLHIENLYKNQDIMLFRECYALEKVHGSSAHVSWNHGVLGFFAGGESHERFVATFNSAKLTEAFIELGLDKVLVYGEVYGGKCQGMSATYGPDLRFIAFDVKIGESWLPVPSAERLVERLGLEFVPYRRCPTELAILDQLRDSPSEVAMRRGCGEKKREGIVLRPLSEFIRSDGARVIAKHKRADFSERVTPQKVTDPTKLLVLEEAQAIAQEWVTPMRLSHVLDKIPGAKTEQTGEVIKAMIEDVYREGRGELVESKEASSAIGKRTAQLFKERLRLNS